MKLVPPSLSAVSEDIRGQRSRTLAQPMVERGESVRRILFAADDLDSRRAMPGATFGLGSDDHSGSAPSRGIPLDTRNLGRRASEASGTCGRIHRHVTENIAFLELIYDEILCRADCSQFHEEVLPSFNQAFLENRDALIGNKDFSRSCSELGVQLEELENWFGAFLEVKESLRLSLDTSSSTDLHALKKHVLAMRVMDGLYRFLFIAPVTSNGAMYKVAMIALQKKYPAPYLRRQKALEFFDYFGLQMKSEVRRRKLEERSNALISPMRLNMSEVLDSAKITLHDLSFRIKRAGALRNMILSALRDEVGTYIANSPEGLGKCREAFRGLFVIESRPRESAYAVQIPFDVEQLSLVDLVTELNCRILPCLESYFVRSIFSLNGYSRLYASLNLMFEEVSTSVFDKANREVKEDRLLLNMDDSWDKQLLFRIAIPTDLNLSRKHIEDFDTLLFRDFPHEILDAFSEDCRRVDSQEFREGMGTELEREVQRLNRKKTSLLQQLTAYRDYYNSFEQNMFINEKLTRIRIDLLDAVLGSIEELDSMEEDKIDRCVEQLKKANQQALDFVGWSTDKEGRIGSL